MRLKNLIFLGVLILIGAGCSSPKTLFETPQPDYEPLVDSWEMEAIGEFQLFLGENVLPNGFSDQQYQLCFLPENLANEGEVFCFLNRNWALNQLGIGDKDLTDDCSVYSGEAKVKIGMYSTRVPIEETDACWSSNSCNVEYANLLEVLEITKEPSCK